MELNIRTKNTKSKRMAAYFFLDIVSGCDGEFFTQLFHVLQTIQSLTHALQKYKGKDKGKERVER